MTPPATDDPSSDRRPPARRSWLALPAIAFAVGFAVARGAYTVEFVEPTFENRRTIAIHDGLWALHAGMDRKDDPILGERGKYTVGATAMAVLAFEVNGFHTRSPSTSSGPARTTSARCGPPAGSPTPRLQQPGGPPPPDPDPPLSPAPEEGAFVMKERARVGAYALALLMTFLWSNPTGVWPVARADDEDPPVEVDWDAAAVELAAIEGLARRGREGLDRTRFDVEALAASLAGPDEAFAFVRDEIALEIYPGSLRGPRGTLMSRAGNSLDQSLLLAALLEGRGGDVRICRTKLSGEEVEGLLSAARGAPARAARPAAGDATARVEALVEEAGIEGGLDRERFAERTREAEAFLDRVVGDAYRHAGLLVGALAEKGIAVEPGDDARALAAEVADHFWVQARADAESPWQDLDPSLASHEVGDRLGGRVGSVDERQLARLAQSIGIDLVLETLVDGKARRAALLYSEFPVAVVSGREMTLSIVPDDALAKALDAGEIESLEEALDALAVFQPVLRIDGEEIVGQPFDLEGKVYDVSKGGDLVDLAGEARGMLGPFGGGGSGRKPASREVVALRLEIETVGAGGKKRTHVRHLVRPRGPGQPSASELRQLKMQAAQSIGLLVLASTLDENLIADRVLATSLAGIGVLTPIVAGLRGQDLEGTPSAALAGLSVHRTELVEWAATRQRLLATILAQRGAGRAYLGAANVVLYRERVVGGTLGEPVLEAGYDILENGLRFVGDEAGRAGKAAPAALVAGVLDTVLEGALVGQANPGRQIVNTAVLFDSLAEPGYRVLRGPEAVEELEPLVADEASRRAIAGDLEAGRAVVLPDRPLAVATWWRVDPDGGATLGRSGAGEGAGMAGYARRVWEVIKIRGVIANLAKALACGFGLANLYIDIQNDQLTGVTFASLGFCIWMYYMSFAFGVADTGGAMIASVAITFVMTLWMARARGHY